MVYQLTVILISIATVVHCNDGNKTLHQCPPWFYYNSTSNKCVCYSDQYTKNDIKCDGYDNTTLLYIGDCMTYDGNKSYVTPCPYFELSDSYIKSMDSRYIQLPQNVTELNDYMCAPLNRKGLVCRECIDGFAPAVFSIGYVCSNCTESPYGVPLYLFLEFVPITIFCVAILIFRINVTSAPMTYFIMYSQLVVAQLNYSITLDLTFKQSSKASQIIVLDIMGTLYGLWNLDFFRYVVPPFCVSDKLKIIHIVFLEYISAFYPLLIIAITWCCIELHDRQFKLIVWLSKPIYSRCFTRIRRSWDSNTSIVDAFATFLLLSYNKLMVQSLSLLSYVYIRNMNDEPPLQVNALDLTIDYLSKEHIPFVVFALFVMVVFTLPALLLTLFPIIDKNVSNCFTRLLGRHYTTVKAFVEKFQGCYKDGLTTKHDYRSFSGLYFILRIVVLLTIPISSWLSRYDIAAFLRGLIFILTAILIAIVRPYKSQSTNAIDTLLFTILGLLSLLITMTFYYVSQDSQLYYVFYSLFVVLYSLPQIGLFVYIIHKLLTDRKISPCHLVAKILHSKKKAEEEDDEDVSHRLINPEHYQPLNVNDNLNDVTGYGSIGNNTHSV